MKQQGPPSPNTPYNRPNRPYVCGRLCEGTPCEFGPLPNGSCPHKDKPCKPKWSLRRKRKWITIFSCVLSLGIIAYCLKLTEINPMLFNPGPLSHHHAKLIRPSADGQPVQCSKCHAVDDNNHWINENILNHDHYIDSHACMDCHTKGAEEDAAQEVNWLKPHGLGNPTVYPEEIHAKFEKDLHCIQCHREHRGANASITVMTEDKCHSCHSQTFESFNNGHPEFTTFPYKGQKSIYFNHGRKEHSTQDCTQCHTYNRLEERHTLTSFEESCAQCHQKNIVDVDKYRFSVFKLPFKASSANPASPLMHYLFPNTQKTQANQLLDYLNKKFQISLFMENILPQAHIVDIEFLKTLFKGCDPNRVKNTLGFLDGEMESYWASLQQNKTNPDQFFLLNFWNRILSENRSDNIHLDVLTFVNNIKSAKEKDVACFYLMQLYQSKELDRAIKDKKDQATLLKLMEVHKSDAIQTLIHTLYSKPQIKLSEAEADLHDELLDIIDGDLDEETWLTWSLNEFYTQILVEEELLELDSIWYALEDDELESKLEDLDLDEILSELLKVKKGRLEAIYNKLREPFTPEETSIELSDDDQELLEELQDIVESEYDDLEWTKSSLSQFFYDLLIEEEYLDLDTLLSYLDDEELEEALDEADEDELVSTLMKSKKAKLDLIHKQLLKDNLPQKENSVPAYFQDYKESFSTEIKRLKSSQKHPYLFDEPSTQWIYEKDGPEIFYASGLHQDPIQLKLLQGYPMNDHSGLSKKLLAKLGDCSECHTDASINEPQLKKVWTSHHRKTLYNFKHSPHTQNMSMQCNHCHQQEGTGSVTRSGFYPIKKDQCSTCHQANVAGEDCLQCHNYHADQLSSDIKETKALIKFLGLDQNKKQAP